MNQEIIQLTYKLCAHPSITGSEGVALSFLVSWLLEQGFIVKKISVGQERYNIFAYFEERPRFNVMYCSHIDTVVPFIEPRIDMVNQRIFGRGSCDAKGILAAMIYALLRQREKGCLENALLVTVGEEESSDGAKIANSALKRRAAFLVIGEPTELKAASAQKGSLVFDLEAKGQEAHSAMPHLGVSAIHRLVKNIKHLIDYPWPYHEDFKDTFINFGEIEGGTMRNVLARTAKAKAIMRTTGNALPLLNQIKQELSEGITISIISISDPFFYYVPQGYESFVASFGSDAPYLKDIGRPLLIGPGSLELAHKPEESVSFLELYEGAHKYFELAHQLKTENPS